MSDAAMTEQQIDYQRIASKLETAKNRSELVTKAHQIQHIPNDVDRERLNAVFKRRYEELREKRQ